MNMRARCDVTIVFSIVTVCAVGLSAAERSIAAEVVATVDNTKQHAPAPPTSVAAAATCKAAWEAADLNKNGVLDPNEQLIYNAALAAKHKPPLTDTNLNQAGFLKECESLTAHE